MAGSFTSCAKDAGTAFAHEQALAQLRIAEAGPGFVQLPASRAPLHRRPHTGFSFQTNKKSFAVTEPVKL
jgi:hypothetical protein